MGKDSPQIQISGRRNQLRDKQGKKERTSQKKPKTGRGIQHLRRASKADDRKKKLKGEGTSKKRK